MAITITPNMNLTAPGVGTEPGPNWALEVNADLTTIDQHNHSSGNGVQIQPNGIDINSDLPFNSNNAILLRSVRWIPQTIAIPNSAPDIGCCYVSGNELYYNDVTGGNQVQLTKNGNVNSGAGSISGLPFVGAASYSGGTYTWEAGTSGSPTPATMASGSLAISPSSSATFATTIEAYSALAASYTLTLPAAIAAANGSLVTSDSSGNLSYTTIDNNTLQIIAGILSVKVAAITPSGAILAYGGTSAPTGYLICDGTSYLQASYPNLYAAIGAAYGSADGTHFNVPDLRGLFARGVDNGAGNDPDTLTRTASNAGGNTGDNVGSYEMDAFQGHFHSSGGFTNTSGAGSVAQGGTGGSGPVTLFAEFAASDGINGTPRVTSESRPKNVYVNYIIKV